MIHSCTSVVVICSTTTTSTTQWVCVRLPPMFVFLPFTETVASQCFVVIHSTHQWRCCCCYYRCSLFKSFIQCSIHFSENEISCHRVSSVRSCFSFLRSTVWCFCLFFYDYESSYLVLILWNSLIYMLIYFFVFLVLFFVARSTS